MAAWVTTSCNVANPSMSTPTAGRRPHNHPPTAPLQQPDGPPATHNLTTGTTTHQNDRAEAGSGTTGPTANQPATRLLAPPGTNHTAKEPTPRPQTDQMQTSKYRTGRTCKGRTETASSGLATPWCATPANDHTYEHNYTPQLYHFGTDQPTTTTYYRPPAPRGSASSTKSGGVSTCHGMRVP